MDKEAMSALSGLSGVGSVVGAVVNPIAQYFQNQSDRQFQREMLAAEQAFTREMWNANNNYNAPVKQVERLKEAGLNPALMYGNGADSGLSTLAGNPSVGAPNQQAPEINALAMAQVANLNAQAKATSDENDRKNGMFPYEIAAKDTATKLANSATELNKAQVTKVMADAGVAVSTANKLAIECDTMLLQQREFAQGMKDRLAILSNQRYMSDVDAAHAEELVNQNLENLKASLMKIKAETSKARAEAAKANRETQFFDAKEKEIEATIGKIDAERKVLMTKEEEQQILNDLKRKYGDKEAQEHLKKMKQERITGYIHAGCEVANTACNVVNTFKNPLAQTVTTDTYHSNGSSSHTIKSTSYQ